MRTAGVKRLVHEVIKSLPQPYSRDIIDNVFCAIEGNDGWLDEYKALSKELTVAVTNNWIGQWTKYIVGKTASGWQVKSKSRLAKTCSPL